MTATMMPEYVCDVKDCPALGCILPSSRHGDLLLCGHHFRRFQVQLAMVGFSEVAVVDNDHAREVASALLTNTKEGS